MALYYLPILIRSDRYFVAKLDSDTVTGLQGGDRLQFCGACR